MEVFARHNRVLFVNSIGMRRPSTAHPDFLRRITRKLGSIARLVRRAQPSLYVFSPIALPFFGSPAVRRINSLALRFQIGTVLRMLGMRRPILWIGLPTYADMLGRFGARLTVFQATDKYDAYEEIRDDYVTNAFRRLASESDVVLVSSKRLGTLLGEMNESVYHVSHGVDFDHFSQAKRNDLALPGDLESIPTPRLGYVGSLDQVVDHELLRFVAQRKPGWHIVLVGPHSGEADALRSLENVHLLGARPPEVVPAYLKGFDACLMPWKQDEWISFCNPIKTKEYLSAGRQVVTMHYDEVAEVERWLWVARSRDEFLSSLEAVVDRGETKDLSATEAWLRESTWERQSARAAEIFARYLARTKPPSSRPRGSG